MNAFEVLVFNAGSSSIKYAWRDWSSDRVLVSGVVDGIGTSSARWHHADTREATEHRSTQDDVAIADHEAAFHHIADRLAPAGRGNVRAPAAIGHRVVHGGSHFRASVRLDAATIRRLHDVSVLAPLHNRVSLAGIEVMAARFSEVPQIAVFDTAFHADMPEHAWRYALPREWDEYGVRRYGFHGLSHRHALRRAAAIVGREEADMNMISLHLGNGASVTAVRDGKSVDTSMGMTPLEGLIMGTRCGDIDAAIPAYIARCSGVHVDTIDAALNHDSGLRALCGAGDMREVHRLADGGDHAAGLAREMFCYRVKKYIGAYHAVLGRIDAIVFTGGIGENDPRIRAMICDDVRHLGVGLDAQRNHAGAADRIIHDSSATVPVLVVHADEAFEIARETYRCATT